VPEFFDSQFYESTFAELPVNHGDDFKVLFAYDDAPTWKAFAEITRGDNVAADFSPYPARPLPMELDFAQTVLRLDFPLNRDSLPAGLKTFAHNCPRINDLGSTLA
jgi:hypothetical protein